MKCALFLNIGLLLVVVVEAQFAPKTVLKKVSEISNLFFLSQSFQQKYQINQELDVPCNVSMCSGPLSSIYCHGPILTNSWIFGLEKTCPGNKLRCPAKEVIANFDK